mmetsp:Transcript_23921/g.68894  ORF Transcript_23921/g.68894 Transcript_23921/m.68894 type:complete len:125 (-) Transcript_23921:891-1265(-)
MWGAAGQGVSVGAAGQPTANTAAAEGRWPSTAVECRSGPQAGSHTHGWMDVPHRGEDTQPSVSHGWVLSVGEVMPMALVGSVTTRWPSQLTDWRCAFVGGDMSADVPTTDWLAGWLAAHLSLHA